VASDDALTFLASAQHLIDDERRKNHTLLARELEAALRDPRGPGGPPVLSLKPVPTGRDEMPLLTLANRGSSSRTWCSTRASRPPCWTWLRRTPTAACSPRTPLRPRQKLLLVGPPGTGKSAAVHAIATELSLPVATVSLAALTSSFLGQTARNIEAVIRFAETTPCVLLLDELDALAAERSAPGDHGEIRRVVATLLQALEHLRGESVVVATTNHPAVLDSAIWRRFDEVIRLGLLDDAGAAQLIRLRTRTVQVTADIDVWAGRLVGLSPAEIELVCLDALRHVVTSSDDTLGDAHLAAAERGSTARLVALG